MRRSASLFNRASKVYEKFGLTVNSKVPLKDEIARHRSIMNLFDLRPLMSLGTWIAPNATLIGKVMMLTHSSIWYGAVLRGDKSRIQIGTFTNIQERVIINTVQELASGFSPVVQIGAFVSVGHGSVLTSCVIEGNVSIGAGCIIPQGCVIEPGCILAPGTVLLPDTLVPKAQLWAGNPAQYIRDVTEEEIEKTAADAERYTYMAREHGDEFFKHGHAFYEAEAKGVIPGIQ